MRLERVLSLGSVSTLVDRCGSMEEDQGSAEDDRISHQNCGGDEQTKTYLKNHWFDINTIDYIYIFIDFFIFGCFWKENRTVWGRESMKICDSPTCHPAFENRYPRVLFFTAVLRKSI